MVLDFGLGMLWMCWLLPVLRQIPLVAGQHMFLVVLVSAGSGWLLFAFSLFCFASGFPLVCFVSCSLHCLFLSETSNCKLKNYEICIHFLIYCACFVPFGVKDFVGKG